MNSIVIWGCIMLIAVVIVLWLNSSHSRQMRAMSPEERKAFEEETKRISREW